VRSVEVKDMGDIKGVYHITVTEAYPDIRGRKVLLWVDDAIQRNNQEFHDIMDESEKSGVTCVHLHSTLEAQEFFNTHIPILGRGINGLRIITDMARHEGNKKLNIEAGLELAVLLRSEPFNYTQPILCYTGNIHLMENRKKFQAVGLTNVYVSSTYQDAASWARFYQIQT